jgi:uridine kinase
MRILFLISGSLRTFRENVKRFSSDYDFAIYISQHDEDTYFNPYNQQFLFEDPRFKYLYIEPLPIIPSCYTDERQQNMYKQWYKLHRLIQYVPKDYDLYVRIRPDVCVSNIESLLQTIPEGIRIPQGNDRGGLNDQIAIGNYVNMVQYCNTFHTLNPNVISEINLQQSLQIPIERVELSYKLILSTAKVIAITGDSGSGKTTLCKLIQPLFFFDKVLHFETDRYHKWERGNTQWSSYTHLNPEANYLEKLEEDTFNLKLGNNIIAVDYDHDTGHFTTPQTIEPKENILLCGLHTLYSKQLRDLSDLKIYVDTSHDLKTKWKIQRDVHERHYDSNVVLSKIESRKIDYETYISPQKEHADIIIQQTSESLILYIRKEHNHSFFRQLPCIISYDKDFAIIEFHDSFIDIRELTYSFLQSKSLPIISIELGFNGILQLLLLKELYG